MIRTLALACLLAAPAHADEAQDFITANIISALYHEFAHALIDVTNAPLTTPPEDAADILSILLLDDFWQEDAASSITALTAFSFDLAAQEAEDPAFWRAHGLTSDRYYHQVCLFHGADPAARASLAEEFGISDKQAAACVQEFATASAGWRALLDDLATQTPTKLNQFNGDTTSDIATLLAQEARDLNASFALPKPIKVTLADCGAEDVRFDPKSTTITICTEFVAFLERQTIANDM